MSELTPREVVRELDRYIIGQDEAKKNSRIASQPRHRKQSSKCGEISKIFMISALGWRLSRSPLSEAAPFIKVRQSLQVIRREWNQ